MVVLLYFTLFWVSVVDFIIDISGGVASICVSFSVLVSSSIVVAYSIWLYFESFILSLSLFTCFYCKLCQVVRLDILYLQVLDLTD